MPLSEYEQRELEQMERGLASEDPRFAATFRHEHRRSPLRFVLAGLGVVVGLVLLVVGVALSSMWLGIAGFVLMFVGVVFAFSAPRAKGPEGVVTGDGSVRARSKTAAPSAGSSKSQGFLERLEERWDRRRDQGR